MADISQLHQSGTLQKITKFWKSHGYYDVSYDQLLWAIGEHLKYGTIETVEVNGDIVAFARWNIDGDTATVLDCVIRPDYRHKKIIKLMALKGWKRFPFLKVMQFERGLKDKRTRRINMNKFLRFK